MIPPEGPVQNDLEPEQLICNSREDWTIQCVAMESEVLRCNHGSRNKKWRLCSKHYARFQRNGHTGTSHGGLAKKRKKETAELKRLKLTAEGRSTVCLCAHKLDEHSQNENCLIIGCRCNQFSSINALLFRQTMIRFAGHGFMPPLNDTARCRQCLERVWVGSWIDPMAIRRMKEHLRVKHIVRSFGRAG